VQGILFRIARESTYVLKDFKIFFFLGFRFIRSYDIIIFSFALDIAHLMLFWFLFKINYVYLEIILWLFPPLLFPVLAGYYQGPPVMPPPQYYAAPPPRREPGFLEGW
jgi:hypothetical protein